jgi:hypothetical protein
MLEGAAGHAADTAASGLCTAGEGQFCFSLEVVELEEDRALGTRSAY